jgi:hypothetical protein
VRFASREYIGKNCNLQYLADSIHEQFTTEGYDVQSAKKDGGWVIQARKTGLLRDLLAADRAFTMMVSGEPADFKVSIGMGKWMQNLGVAALEALALVPAVLFVEVPVALWSWEIESKFWQFVEKEVEMHV